jgi:predicted glycogen debranching enzyme
MEHDIVRDMHPASHLGYDTLLTREWLVTNGLGGYASSTVSGIPTRRYHGILVAALPAPLGRTIMLNHIEEIIVLPNGERVDLHGDESADRRINYAGLRYLKNFRLVRGLPVWRYEIGDIVLEKSILLPQQQNTVHVTYCFVGGNGTIDLELRPAIHYRSLEAPVDQTAVAVDEYQLTVLDSGYELHGGIFPPMTMRIHGAPARFTVDRRRRSNVLFRLEESRGYPAIGEHWSPGSFEISLSSGEKVTLIASAEARELAFGMDPEEAFDAEDKRRQHLLDIAGTSMQKGMAAELVLAADQFIITPAGRAEQFAHARAGGSETKTVIAGYHWFTDWGRDTMISLEGLCLVTGRSREAGDILRTFANYVRDGLIPNMFPEHGNTGLYHTADASLWFFHALHRYVQATQDRETLRIILPKLNEIVEHHLRGTLFNIGVDPGDGLLRQGMEGYQLTWMDAKVNDWVVTPRRGKTVELNALWYNALRLLGDWTREELNDTKAATTLHMHAERARQSFNQRFWSQDGYLYDLVDGEQGDDASFRPNQLFAITLDHPILAKERWSSVLNLVQEKLLTPVGLRSLSQDHPDYKENYHGDLKTRDAAYHQGTVWGWLIGPFVDAWLKVHPDDKAGALTLLSGFEEHLGESGMGSISEVFDAEQPFTPRGCIAQAWSVAEVLRCLKNCTTT